MSDSRHPLVSEQLLADPRLKQAKEIMLEALQSHQKSLNGIKSPDPARKLDYQLLLEQFKEIRGGTPLWYPYIGSGIGNGPFVELLDGSVKYDLICGIGPHYFGHSHPLYFNACFDAALCNTIMQGHLQQNEDSLILMKMLCKLSNMDHCFLASSGVMAVENALKIAFQHKHPASRLLAFERGFAGRSLAAAQITDKPQFRQGLPPTLVVDYVPFYNESDPESSTQRTLHCLRNHLKRYPGQHAAMLIELVQGEAGFYTGSKEFFTQLMEALHRENVLVIADEIQTFARTPAPFAMQYYEVGHLVDLAATGKVSHACATLYRRKVCPKPGLLSQTFSSSTAAIKATLAFLHELSENNYFGPKGHIIQLHDSFGRVFENLSKKHPKLIQGPFGVGAMIAFTVYEGDEQKSIEFAKALFEAGIIAFVAGDFPKRIRFLPPVGILKESDFSQIGDILEEVLLANR